MAKSASADVYLMNYRLLPDADYRDQLNDVRTAYRWLLYSGYLADNVAVIGDSYGATLVIAAMTRQMESSGRKPSSIVALSPVLGRKNFDGPSDPQDPLWSLTEQKEAEPAQRSAVAGAGSPPQDFPPMLIQVGSDETIAESTKSYVELHKAGGMEITMTTWPGMVHGWQLFPGTMDLARKSNQEAADFVMRHFETKTKE